MANEITSSTRSNASMYNTNLTPDIGDLFSGETKKLLSLIENEGCEIAKEWLLSRISELYAELVPEVSKALGTKIGRDIFLNGTGILNNDQLKKLSPNGQRAYNEWRHLKGISNNCGGGGGSGSPVRVTAFAEANAPSPVRKENFYKTSPAPQPGWANVPNPNLAWAKASNSMYDLGGTRPAPSTEAEQAEIRTRLAIVSAIPFAPVIVAGATTLTLTAPAWAPPVLAGAAAGVIITVNTTDANAAPVDNTSHIVSMKIEGTKIDENGEEYYELNGSKLYKTNQTVELQLYNVKNGTMSAPNFASVWQGRETGSQPAIVSVTPGLYSEYEFYTSDGETYQIIDNSTNAADKSTKKIGEAFKK